MSDITDPIDENPIAGALGHTDHHKKLAKKANALGELVTDGYLAEDAIVPNTPEGRTALAGSNELSAAFATSGQGAKADSASAEVAGRLSDATLKLTLGSLLASLSVATTAVSTTTEVPLFAADIPGGLPTGTAARLLLTGDYLNDSGHSRSTTVRIKLGSQTLLAKDITVGNNTLGRSWVLDAMLVFVGSAAQIVTATMDVTSAEAAGWRNNSFGFRGPAAGTVDLSTAKSLVVSVQHNFSHPSLEMKAVAGALMLLPKAG